MIPDPHDDIRWCYDLLTRSEVREDDYQHGFAVLDAGLAGSKRPVALAAARVLYGSGALYRRVIRCQGVLAQHVAELEAAATGGPSQPRTTMQRTSRKVTFLPKDLTKDPRLEGLSWEERGFIMSLWCWAEDDGRGWAKDAIESGREKDRPLLRATLSTYARRGLVELFTDDGELRYRIIDWRQPSAEERGAA